MDPIHQFQIVNLFPIAKIGNHEIFFTNSALMMLIAVTALTAFLVIGTAGARPVPGRLQSAAELSYEFVATMLRSTGGSEGMRFFPFVFTIFMFVLLLNMFGIIPYAFTVTSHIIITAVLALTVFFTVLVYGLIRHGFHFFNLFVPKGVPIYILPMIVFIEVLSFISRPAWTARSSARSCGRRPLRWIPCHGSSRTTSSGPTGRWCTRTPAAARWSRAGWTRLPDTSSRR